MKNTYREMKDSGVAWIGAIPTIWDTKHLFQLTIQVKNKNSALLEQNLLSLSYGKIKRKSIETTEGLLPASFDNYNIVEKDDIVLRLTDLQNDHTSLRVGKVEEKGIITSAYVSVRPVLGVSKYIYYALHSFDLKKGFYGMGSGVRQGLNFTEAKMIRIPFPELPEQTAIAAYLDEKCGTIDEIIAEAKASIEEYKAWKSSVIFEAVTKGLDPHAEMKDSGVEWIGKVPKIWKVTSLKRVSRIQTGNTPSKQSQENYYSDDDGTPWIKADNLGTCNSIETTSEYLTAKGVEAARLNPENTVYVCCIGTIGKTGFSTKKCTCNQQINAVVFNDLMFWKFGFYSICAQEEQHWFYANGNVLKILNTENQKNIKITIPPMKEQRCIVDYLDEKCAAIDGIIAEKEALITDMEAYKKSLIFETVTGKRKVC